MGYTLAYGTLVFRVIEFLIAINRHFAVLKIIRSVNASYIRIRGRRVKKNKKP